MAGRPSSRNQVLAAATELVAEIGAGHLTLDAVAARAGVSKGGLLYHFRTKEALLRALVEGFIERYADLVRERAKALATDPNPVLRATLSARVDPSLEDRKAAHGMLAALAENPRLVEPVRAANAQTVSAIAEDSTDPEAALILWLAMEGLLLKEMLGTSPFDAAGRDRVVEMILKAAGSLRPAPGRGPEEAAAPPQPSPAKAGGGLAR